MNITDEQVRDPLEAAARSLRTIAEQAGRGEYLKDMIQVCGYANSRATVAEKALAARVAGSVPEGLAERIESAIQRIKDGHACMRVPADATDPDLVLAEVLAWIKGQKAPFWVKPATARAGVDAAVLAELELATTKFPTWPTDPLHALAVLGEEFGELGKAVLQSVYEPHKVKPGEVRAEAVQTAAMALRFLMSLDAYVYAPGEQHQQGGGNG
jgi:hypothetical protein